MSDAGRLYGQIQLSAFPVEDEPRAPSYEERPLHYGAPKDAFKYLESLDWSFTYDDTRFLAHDLHPYPAKFIPQLPGTLISLLSSRGELVFDPFGGSGTTALEAIRLGRRALSTDANPIAALIGRVKTARVTADSSAELHLLHGSLRSLLLSPPRDASVLLEKYQSFAPTIPNRQKWFSDEAYGELAHVKFRISHLHSETARDIASLALSRTVLAASFQDSETRYKSVPRTVPIGETTRRYVKEFEFVMRSVARNAAATRYGIARFLTADIRSLSADDVPDRSIDLIVTSPPYGNATDYHLYHRFRMFWLGHNPVALGKVEIGSHLRHQRESSGFDSYFQDMLASLASISRVLKYGRYAALIIGDSVYGGETYDTARLLAEHAVRFGFDENTLIDRPIHQTRRSFTHAGRRASGETILILRKISKPNSIYFQEPPYRLWPYEAVLRVREIDCLLNTSPDIAQPTSAAKLDVAALHRAKTLVFTHKLDDAETAHSEPTWQAILENGSATTQTARKDPKYVTHGLHPYKGKFYPQLAKGLINQLNLSPGARILDPFCGSGTSLLEGYLNGYKTYGCDLHPLATHITKAKTAILDVDPDLVTEVATSVIEAIDSAPTSFKPLLDQFHPSCHDEIRRWFPTPVTYKLNWLLHIIRSISEGPLRDFLEVIASSIIRDVSQQEPSDLRIRYRKHLLEDADVLGLFKSNLQQQFGRLEKFWEIRGYAPNPFFPCRVIHGDNRARSTYEDLGLSADSVDLILTSPPYAMALPYIDTDRLSLLILYGLDSSQRRPMERSLIGSRELTAKEKRRLEASFLDDPYLPEPCINFLRGIHHRLVKCNSAGFRRKNMPALIYRFLKDMDSNLRELYRIAKPGAEAMIVIGDSKMSLDGRELRIPTTDFVETIALSHGFSPVERIDISVTTENLVHIKNSITENVVLRLKK